MFQIISNSYEVVDPEIPSKKSIKQVVRQIESGNVDISTLESFLNHQTGDKKFDKRIEIYYQGRTKASARAMRELGMLYYTGKSPVKKSHRQAYKYISQAAYQSDPNAMRRLGQFYEKGIGCDRSLSKAETWYIKAAVAGNKQAKKDSQWCREQRKPTGRNPRYLAARTFTKY